MDTCAIYSLTKVVQPNDVRIHVEDIGAVGKILLLIPLVWIKGGLFEKVAFWFGFVINAVKTNYLPAGVKKY